MVVSVDQERHLALRIYEGAHPGALVATLRPEELAPGITVTDIRLTLRGPDRSYFNLEGNSLIVSYPIRRRVNEKYQVNLEVTSRAPSNYVIAIWNVTITVTRKNQYAPRFPQDFFTAEVYRFAEENKKILQLQAYDADRETYNADVSYRLVNNEMTRYFTIDNDSGWIKVSASLKDAKPLLHLQVVAMDTGSPPMQMTTTVTIILRDIAGKHQLYDFLIEIKL